MNHEAFWPRLKTLNEYSHKASQAAFLLGGIGTGNVSLGARGELLDWEVFNRPGKGNLFPYTFFALHVNNGREGPGQFRLTRVLEGPMKALWMPDEGALAQCEAYGRVIAEA